MNVVSLNNVSLDGNVIRKGASGGGSSAVTSASVSDVNFLDYDGTILYSYTKEQFLALSAMPKLPTKEGLVCQGWNWDLNDAKEYVTDYGMLNIGAMYITDDGDTRLYIRIATEGRMTVPLRWSQTVENGVGIDWGDGSDIESFSGTGNKDTTHTYAKYGDYVIRLKVVDGCTLGWGSGSSSYCVMGSTSSNGKVYCNMLQKAEIGTRVTSIGNNAFYNCRSLASVSIPSGVTSIGGYAFYNCYSLASVSIPNGVTSIGEDAFYSCYSLASVSIPNGVTSIGSGAFYNCRSLPSVSIPSGVTSIGSGAFSECYSLASVSIPSGVTSIGNNAFSDCQSLPSVSIPSSVTSIGNNAFRECCSLASVSIPNGVTSIGNSAFYDCRGMAIYDFANHTSVPTLTNTNAFYSIPSDCVIKVPESLLEEWKAATNWSSYASLIVGV